MVYVLGLLFSNRFLFVSLAFSDCKYTIFWRGKKHLINVFVLKITNDIQITLIRHIVIYMSSI